MELLDQEVADTAAAGETPCRQPEEPGEAEFIRIHKESDCDERVNKIQSNDLILEELTPQPRERTEVRMLEADPGLEGRMGTHQARQRPTW